MIKANIKEVLDADIQTVWNIITNNNDYSWRSDLSKIEVISETKFIEYDKNNFETAFIITKKEPYQYEFDIDNKNIKGHWIGILTEQNNQTILDFTEKIEVSNIVMKLMAKGYLKKQQQKYINDLNKKLKTLK